MKVSKPHFNKQASMKYKALSEEERGKNGNESELVSLTLKQAHKRAHKIFKNIQKEVCGSL